MRVTRKSDQAPLFSESDDKAARTLDSVDRSTDQHAGDTAALPSGSSLVDHHLSEIPAAIPAAVPQRIPIDRLRPNPLAADLVSADHVNALAASLRVNGQSHPCTVTMDLVILDGHHRVEAARRLEWRDIEVVIRPFGSEDPRAVADFHTSQLHRRRSAGERNLLLLRSLERLAAQSRLDGLGGRGAIAGVLGVDVNTAGKLVAIATSAIPIVRRVYMSEPLPTARIQAVHQLSQLEPAHQQRIVETLGDDARQLTANAVQDLRHTIATSSNAATTIDVWCADVRKRMEAAAADAVAMALGSVAEVLRRVRAQLPPTARRLFDRRAAELLPQSEAGISSPESRISREPAPDTPEVSGTPSGRHLR